MKIIENPANEIKTRKAIDLIELKGKVMKLDKQKLNMSITKFEFQEPNRHREEITINGDMKNGHLLRVETEKSLYTLTETQNSSVYNSPNDIQVLDYQYTP